MEYKIGIGYDIHRLVKGRKLFLGGIAVPYHKGLLGHSDADVLIHALADALLGAAGLGDIGEHFPDTDKRYKGLSGKDLLAEVQAMIARKKFSVINIDLILIAEEPKILPLRKKIQQNLSRMLKIDAKAVSLKGKTQEKLGEIGQKKAIAAFAIALLAKRR
ncbi:MAG: 2-C-methyl-D-erythritol 2,4-cyclodiphosphate synthase [Candidatus Omnitrophica bacterium]|nr:2-C-methyl-D-erythritol 2,4-cyclodiphosphate synthase [Candidatus Omnitrophota bacterium]MDD5653237.1 2-C-methyl-D-erythritol 2,4-cyclodiphosphate synthase [Candidatus Omnitrophota bacterium]